MSNSTDFQPNWASAPGSTIADILREQKLSLEEFAKKMNRTSDFIKELIHGYIEITNDVAKKLEETIGASAEFWMNRELQYRTTLTHLQKSVEDAWIKKLPINDMVKFGWIKKSKNLVTECLNYFNVTDINTWQKKYVEVIGTAAFRTSASFKSEHGAVSAWFRQGEILGSLIECKRWNEKLFEETLIKTIRPLTRKKDPKDFLPILIKACAECGVAVVIVRTPSGCPASGATKFLTPERALLVLSFRYLSDDQFWFTFFHEAGHLLLHGNKIFIEEVGGERAKTQEENDANFFAGDILIPNEFQAQLKTIRGNKRTIINFAMLAGVSPGIVVGQLQHFGFIAPQYLNAYKRRYKWDDLSKLAYELYLHPPK